MSTSDNNNLDERTNESISLNINISKDDLIKILKDAGVQFKDDNPPPPPLDTQKPVIKLIGNQRVEIDQGEPYHELGATVTDDDPNYNENVMVTGIVHINQPGIYNRLYTAPPDKAGNKPDDVIRTIVVKQKVIKPDPPIGGLPAKIFSQKDGTEQGTIIATQNPYTAIVDCAPTQLNAGTIHESYIEWDFGDSSPLAIMDPRPNKGVVDSGKKQTSSCAAHVYRTPGTYTITVRIIDKAKNVYIASRDIVIPVNEKIITRINPSDDLDTIFSNGIPADYQIIFSSGHYIHRTDSPIMIPSGAHIICEPNVTFESIAIGNIDVPVFLVEQGCTIEGININCTGTRKRIFEFRRIANCTLIGCSGTNGERFVSITDTEENIVLIDCNADKMLTYAIAGKGNNNILVLGGYHGPIDGATGSRYLGDRNNPVRKSHNIIYSWVFFDSPRGEESVRFQHNDGCYITECRFTGPTVGFGHDADWAENIVFERNYCELKEGDFMVMMKALRHIWIQNNIFDLTPSPRFARLVTERVSEKDIYEFVNFIHNTFIVREGSQVQKILERMQGSIAPNNVTVAGNLFVMSHTWITSDRELILSDIFANSYEYNVHPLLFGNNRYGPIDQIQYVKDNPNEKVEIVKPKDITVANEFMPDAIKYPLTSRAVPTMLTHVDYHRRPRLDIGNTAGAVEAS